MSYQKKYSEFLNALHQFDKNAVVAQSMSLLESGQVTIVDLYKNYLAKGLSEIASNNKSQSIPIWQEHVMSNIVRSVIEISYPYVQKEKNNIGNNTPTLKAVVLCLSEEYHDLGARMVQDFLEILGFDTLFIGANTPDHEIEDAIASIQPNLVCISITSYYHLTQLHKLAESLDAKFTPRQFKLAIGGYAVNSSNNVFKQLSVDHFITSFEDLKDVKEGLL